MFLYVFIEETFWELEYMPKAVLGTGAGTVNEKVTIRKKFKWRRDEKNRQL